LLQKFIQSIARRTGLSIRSQDWERLQGKIESRVRALQLPTAQEYYLLLEASETRSSLVDVYRSDKEWKKLINALTVTESYFFRDIGQFNLLGETILPQIIERKRQSKTVEIAGKPTLRIWSAACASGEEPYSLAIVLQECLPDFEEWDITILATDINEEALERAKRGVYSNWSFRPMESELKQHYFQPEHRQWKIDDRLRKFVEFQRLNLVREPFPNSLKNIEKFDLILFRNVSIYLEDRAISDVIHKFYHTLDPGGYLMSAHGEIPSQLLARFKTHIFPQSIVYQRPPEEKTVTLSARVRSSAEIPPQDRRHSKSFSPSPFPDSPRSRTPLQIAKQLQTQVENSHPGSVQLSTFAPKTSEASRFQSVTQIECPQIFREADRLFQDGFYSAAIQQLEPFSSENPRCLQAYSKLAQAYAKLGDYRKATYYCIQVLEIDSLHLEIYYLLARISELNGNLQKAKALLKKIIYIDPNASEAYLELSQLYQKEGKIDKSHKMRQNAIELLQLMPRHQQPQIQIRVGTGEG